MKPSSKVQALNDMIAPAVAACGLKLWGIEFSPQGKRSLLRVYIDVAHAASNSEKSVSESVDDATCGKAANNAVANKDSGVSVDDCVRVSHQISGVLEVHDPIHGEYVLEVSSPGWDRRFFEPEQMLEFIGEQVAVRLIHAHDGRRKYTGKLVAADGDSIALALQDTGDAAPTTILVSNIDKANLVYTAA